MPPPLVILDRDGVINQDSDEYIKSPEEFVPIPGSLEAIGRLHRTGVKVAIATNQAGVDRGILSAEALDAIHAKLLALVKEHGGAIDHLAVCTSGPWRHDPRRKPGPAMLHEIAGALGHPLEGVPFVGDTASDIEAARAAGARPVLVRTGKGMRTIAARKELNGVWIFDDLSAAVNAMLAGRVY